LRYNVENAFVADPNEYSATESWGTGVAPRPMAGDAALLAAAQGVTVEAADAARLATIRAAWDDLIGRAAEPNVFMDPSLLCVASEANSAAPVHALLAWKTIDDRQRLVGVWAFSIGRPQKSSLPVRMLRGPACPHSHLATPVIDSDCLDETLDAMLDRIARDATLPKIIALEAIATGGPTMAALTRVLAARDSAPCIFESFRRPQLASVLDAKQYLEHSLSGSTRKKLRQHRRRLSEAGSVASVIDSEPEDVRRALESFLALEVDGWKGRQGTAILCSDVDAAFMRAAVSALSALGCASIHSIHVDGHPVSMQIVARCGRAAFTWKTTYDERFQDFSPGMLLLEDYTATFLADRSIAYVDSCAHDDKGFMSAWSERQTIADLWVDARRGGSFAFRLWSSLQRHYRNLRTFAKNRYLARKRAHRPPAGAALSFWSKLSKGFQCSFSFLSHR
jgi:CelD/BcsL family acetyltransferase involved in cellulose biosynthesis